MENATFSAIDQWNGKTGRALSCGDLYINMVEAVAADGDVGMHGRITIVGPEKPDGEEVRSEVYLTIFQYFPYEDFFDAVSELESAAAWKGLIGNETWSNMYRSRQ